MCINSTLTKLLFNIINKECEKYNYKLLPEIHNECIKELSTFVFPEKNNEENIKEYISELQYELKNYCERYFTYFTILYLEMKNQYDRTLEEMIVYECMKELYDIPENHDFIINYMASLCI